MVEASVDADAALRQFLHARVRPYEGVPVGPGELRRRLRESVLLRGFDPSLPVNNPVWGDVLHPDPTYSIRKLRYEAVSGYWIPALFYEPAGLSRLGLVPVVLNPGGHHPGGKAAAYMQARCANLARRGMMSLSIEFVGMGELGGDCDHNQLAHLELTGLAAPGLMYAALERGLDLLLDHPHADQKRVAVTGLSGGGWQTIMLSALDPRVTACIPVAGYTSLATRIDWLEDIGDLEQVPSDFGAVTDYQELTALLSPRPALIILNERDDCCFRPDRTRPVIYDAIRSAYAEPDRFELYINSDPGTHNYDADNRSALYRFLNRWFGLETPEHDLHRPEELVSDEALRVGLPEDQATIGSLALARARMLRRARRKPCTAAEKDALRQAIAEVIRLPEYESFEQDSSIGPRRVPVTMATADTVAEIWLADDGVAATPPGVIGVDLLGCGSQRAHPRLQMLVGCVGERMLGIQVAQLLAVVRRYARSRVRLVANGMACSLAALVAAALEPSLFSSLAVTGSVATLEHVIERGVRYEDAQSVFCFGLLEVADFPELATLLDDVEYLQPDRKAPKLHAAVNRAGGR